MVNNQDPQTIGCGGGRNGFELSNRLEDSLSGTQVVTQRLCPARAEFSIRWASVVAPQPGAAISAVSCRSISWAIAFRKVGSSDGSGMGLVLISKLRIWESKTAERRLGQSSGSTLIQRAAVIGLI